MSSTRVSQVSFAGGEISADMWGRQDDTKYQNGLKLCSNFVALPQGPVRNRPGFSCVREVRDSSKATRIIPFSFNSGQTCIVELGDKYARFHSDGGTIMNGDQPYEIQTPWASEDLFTLHFVQSGDILTITSNRYQPHELRRYGWTNWKVQRVIFSPRLTVPTGVKAAKLTSTKDDPNANNYTFKYKVSALNKEKTRESEASEAVSVVANLYATGTTVKISWNAVEGASFYRVYKNVGGLYCYIGDTEELSIIDDNIAGKADVTPRRYDETMGSENAIESAQVVNGGSGYYSPHYISGYERTGTASDGTPCSLPYIVSESIFLSFLMKTISTEVVDELGSGSGAVVVANVSYPGSSMFSINGFTIKNEGRDYKKPVIRVYRKRGDSKRLICSFNAKTTELGTINIPVVDSTGYGAELRGRVSGGKILSVEVLSGGRDYTDPQVKIPEGTGAQIKLNVKTTLAHPSAVGYFEQRRCFGGFDQDPQRIVMTRTGTENDMTYSLPYKDDDCISFQVMAREYNMVEHFIPLGHLIVLTSGSEIRISPMNNDAITPTSIAARPQGYQGASIVQPVLVNNSCVYASARGGHVLDFSYQYEAGGYTSSDLSIRASHLFNFKTIKDMALSKSPYPIVWCVSSDGRLLGCTYMPSQNLDSWHRHETTGVFESVAAVAEGSEDHLYAVVRRYINGEQKRFIERMEAFDFDTVERAYFVDCGGTYEGEPTTTVKIPWLDGELVSILADGAVCPQQHVKNGQITLDEPARIVHVGLPYTSDIQTLPITLNQPGNGNGGQKNVYRAFLKVHKTSGLFVGPDFDNLTEYKQRTTEQPGFPPWLFTGDIRLTLSPAWTTSGEFCIRQSDPLPTQLLSITCNVSV